MNIAGGVALLLWATRMVRTGILRAFGTQVRTWLGSATRNRVRSFVTGLAVTSLLQSSTATALLLMSFAGRGLMAVAPALAIMLGADLGSTLVVQVLSFDISALSPAFLFIGVVAFLTSSVAKGRQLGRIVIGLGLMLLSLELIVAASAPLRDSAALATVLEPLTADPILALLLGAVLAWVAHSSVAIVLLVMSLAMAGVVPPALGLALVLGANVGSGLIPFVLSLGSAPVSRRIPVGNLAFRAVGALAVLPLIDLILPYVVIVDADPARQLANFHTVFNLALGAVFLPFTGVMAGLTERLLPQRQDAGEPEEIGPRHLDESAIETPPVALACATREAMRMADIIETMLRDTIEVFRTDDKTLLADISRREAGVDRIQDSIKLYLTRVSSQALDEQDSQSCVDLIQFTTNLEHVGDIIDKNLLELAQKKIRNKQQFSEEGWQELTKLHERVVQTMQLAMSVFISGDLDTARRLIAEKDRMREFEREASDLHLQRLREGRIESIETSSLHLDMLRDLKRINSHLAGVAYPIVSASGLLRQTRLKKTSAAIENL